jgi:hypothetical protein
MMKQQGKGEAKGITEMPGLTQALSQLVRESPLAHQRVERAVAKFPVCYR